MSYYTPQTDKQASNTKAKSSGKARSSRPLKEYYTPQAESGMPLTRAEAKSNKRKTKRCLAFRLVLGSATKCTVSTERPVALYVTFVWRSNATVPGGGTHLADDALHKHR